MWAIEGLKRLRLSGWTKPDTCIAEKKPFRRDSSTPLAFLQDCCQVYKPWLNALNPDVEGIEEMTFTTKEALSDVF